MNDEMAIAFAEFYEILKITSKDLVDKIPADVMETIENRRDKTHHFTVNPRIPISEQPMNPKTRALISVFYRKYWVSPEERERLRERDERELLKKRLSQYEALLDEEDS